MAPCMLHSATEIQNVVSFSLLQTCFTGSRSKVNWQYYLTSSPVWQSILRISTIIVLVLAVVIVRRPPGWLKRTTMGGDMHT
jgi:hypothetical protein